MQNYKRTFGCLKNEWTLNEILTFKICFSQKHNLIINPEVCVPLWIDERTNSSVVGCITKGPHQFVLTSLQASQRPNGQKKAVSWSSPVVQHVQLTVIDFSRRPFRDRVITHSRCPLQRCWVPTRREKGFENWLNPWLIACILEKKDECLFMESFYHNFDGVCLWFLTFFLR